MTPDQFTALAELLRLRGGPAQDVARLVMVDGLSVPEASRQSGLEYRFAHRAVARVKKGLALAEQVVLPRKK